MDWIIKVGYYPLAWKKGRVSWWLLHKISPRKTFRWQQVPVVCGSRPTRQTTNILIPPPPGGKGALNSAEDPWDEGRAAGLRASRPQQSREGVWLVLLPAPMALYIRGMPHRVLHTPYLSHIPYTVSNNSSNNKGESFFLGRGRQHSYTYIL